MSNFLKIAITWPDSFIGEVEQIVSLLESGTADIVHIRKPTQSASQIANLLKQLPSICLNKIKLHDHFELLDEFNIGGVHLNQRNPVAPANVKSLSCSAHSFEQLDDWKHYDYITLSPIFNSISKSGYKGAFNLNELPRKIKGKRVVALGGVTTSRLQMLREMGFYGAAMVGDIWKRD